MNHLDNGLFRYEQTKMGLRVKCGLRVKYAPGKGALIN